MARTNHAELADIIVANLGGEENLQQVRHCATRLRVVLRDDDKVDRATLESTPGVISVVNAGGQTQVVIGNDVVNVYDAVLKAHPRFADDDSTASTDKGRGGNPVTRFIEVVSSIFVPTLGVLAGTGLVKAALSLGSQLGWFDPTSSTYVIVNAAADAFFYFLPVMLAFTTARRFKADIITSMTLGAALVYPALVDLMSGDEVVTFLGIPVQQFSYASSVIPIILAVWGLSHLERLLNNVIPVIVRKFVVPPISLIIMLPLTLIVVGPITIFLGNLLAAGITGLFTFSPFLAGAIVGGIHQVMVIFGLHWGIIPVMIQEVSATGLTYMLAPILAAVIGQSAAALAVSIKVRNKEMRALSVSAAVSGFLAGITEPAIYGVNLRYKTPFVAALVGGAVGGALISGGGVAATSFVFPSLLGLPAFMTHGNIALLFIGCAAAAIVAFVLTLILPVKQADTPVNDTAPAETTKATDGDVLSPVAGAIIPAAEIDDPVFSTGAMGTTIGLKPTEGTFVSPVSGTVIAAMESGHAYGVQGDNGVEVLVHIGINTVKLNGEHFARSVNKGDTVAVGDILGTADLGAIAAAGYDTTTIVAITNSGKFDSIDIATAHEITGGGRLFTAHAVETISNK